MAKTSYPVGHALAVAHWSKDLMKESLKRTYALKFMSTGATNICQIKTETGKSAGDNITFGLRMQLNGDGILGDGTLEGNEEALITYSDKIYINQLRHAVRSEGKMSEQRVPFSVREESRDGLADWWADRIDTAFFNQLCGNTQVTDTRKTGNQAAIAPSSTHVIYANGKATEAKVGSASASCVITLALIDKAVAKAETLDVPMNPIMINGEKHYVYFMHPYDVYQLRTNTNTGQWLDIQKAAMNGGKVSGNPIFTGALGVYNNVILHSSTRIPTPVTAASNGEVRRGVFCGAQAAAVAFGRESSKKNFYSWKEELFDYDNQLGVAAGSIFGLKKCVFNSKDFATITISTWAPDPATL